MSASTLHCSFEKIGSVRRDAEAFADMLARVVQSNFNSPGHSQRIERQAAHGRIEQIRFLFDQAADDMFYGDIVLIAPLRFVQSVLQHALTTFAKLIFVCL